MKTIQLIYPKLKTTLENLKYVQIGIERPHNIHIEEDNITFPLETTLLINNVPYIITDKDILEFSDISYLNLIVLPEREQNNKYLIIDIAYETAG